MLIGGIKAAFDVICTFQLKNESKPANVSVGVNKYKSSSESVVVETERPNIDYSVECHDNIRYILGDVDNDNDVTSYDAQKILCLAEDSSNIMVSKFNTYVFGTAATIPSWYSDYSYMVCGEVADVDENGKINSTDAKLVLEYDSYVHAGQRPLDTQIGKDKIRTVFVYA